MESQEVMEGGDMAADGNVNSLDGDEWEQVGFGENGGENLGDELLVDLDSYLDDINDRLMISRMVSDSVIKGMVNAVEQEAAEKISAKELEVVNMKEILKFHNVGFDEMESFGSSIMKNELESIGSRRGMTFEKACSEHDKMRESLKGLKNVVREQFKNLKNGINGTRGCSSIKRISSVSELVGLGGILQEKESESWVTVDKMLDSLKMTLENICYRADDMLRLSKSTLCEWHWERDLQEELEAMVMHTSIQTIQEEFEQKLWSESALLSGSQSLDWIEKSSQISNIRKELDAMLKSLSHPETGQLISHGSHDADNFHRKALSNHITFSTSLWDGNGNLEGSRTDVPENYEAVQLKHLSKEELVAYFNTIITKMRRDNESTVQQLTEEYFSLKREYLKERGSSLPHKKDKELDLLRKKIPEVILILDDILVENEKQRPAATSNAESFHSLKDRFDRLLSENHQLREAVRDKKTEVKFLSSQVADAAEKFLQQSIVEANMLKMIGNLNSDLEDARIEAELSEDVYKCFLSEIIGHMICDTEESDLDFLIMQQVYGIILNGVVANAEIPPTSIIEDSDIKSLIAQGICEVLFRESLKDAGEENNELYGKYLTESQNRASLEMKAVEKENQLHSEAEYNKRLEQEIVVLAKSLEEKEKFAMDITSRLTKEREQFELATQEMDNLREDANEQLILASQRSKELELVRGQLAEATSQIEEDGVEIQKLNKKLDEAYQDLEDADKQRKMALALNQKNHASFLLAKSKEMEFRNQMEAVMVDVLGLSKMVGDFEYKVAGKIKASSLRFEESSSQLSSLQKKAKLLKRTGRIYQQRLESRCADLQMAEAEVDLLGDEVDKLLNLLEKIHIALNHYSPVLKHYPGVIESLKLIRRELSGESMKQQQFSPC